MSPFDHQSAPFLAQEEEQRGDNLAARIEELTASGQDTTYHQMAVRDAYGNAARNTTWCSGPRPLRQEIATMKHYIAGHQAHSTTDFLELALGTPVALWLGEENETPEERAARLDAARDILADNPGMTEDIARLTVETLDDAFPDLLRLVPAATTVGHPRRAPRIGVAA